jgi:flagellum-specific ATP synthase
MIAAALQHAENLLDHVALNDTPRHVGRLVSHDGGMLEVTGFNRPIGTGARIAASGGGFARAEVVGFRGNRAILVPLDGDAPLENGARVEPDSAANMVQVGEGLIGRVVDAMGQPLDRKGPILAQGVWPLAGVRGNVLDRGRVTEPFDLGVRAVNALLTAGRGQRIAIIAGSGVDGPDDRWRRGRYHRRGSDRRARPRSYRLHRDQARRRHDEQVCRRRRAC